ncbi:MAG TPA: GTPase [Candidatus Competibacteraceae bacterium]|nr:GTPase [Candidatus Competibacteraceae bacterium]
MKLTARGLLVLALTLLPWLALLPPGLLWLWQRDWLLPWLSGCALASGLGWWLQRRLRQVHFAGKPGIAPDPCWAEREREAWREVEATAHGLDLADYPFDAQLPHRLLSLGLRVSEGVARRYRPDSPEPLLDVPLPQVIRTVELVCRDLRGLCEHVPFSHLITLHQWRQVPRLRRLGRLYDVYRVARIATNPGGAVLGELRGYLQGRLYDYTREELSRWLLEEFVKGCGRYAIDLYGDLLAPAAGEVTMLTEASRAARETAQSPPAEPFRVLLLGQTKAGKSSLINALFGELSAATDVLPLTDGLVPYRLERDGLPAALVFDSGGYGDTGPDERQWHALKRELPRSDLILLVVAAHQAARQGDACLLARCRDWFQRHPERPRPPLLVALSHIDLLRPAREWTPPYDIAEPQRPKAQAIRQAIEAVAAALNLAPEHVVPVCLHPARLYNVVEGLVPLALERLADEGARSRYLRCLRERQRTEQWRQLLIQAGNGGRLLFKAGARLGGRALERAREQWRDWLDGE